MSANEGGLSHHQPRRQCSLHSTVHKLSLAERGHLPAPRASPSCDVVPPAVNASSPIPGDLGGEALGGEAAADAALRLVMHTLPLDARACAACVCRAWRDAARLPSRLQELTFEGCHRRIRKSPFLMLLSRAGASLSRLLIYDTNVRSDVTAFAVVRALSDGGCSQLRQLVLFPTRTRFGNFSMKQQLTAESLGLLMKACPQLEQLDCRIKSTTDDCLVVLQALATLSGSVNLDLGWNAFPALTATLPRCITKLRFGNHPFEDACTILFKDLCSNTSLVELHIGSFCGRTSIGFETPIPSLVAEMLRVNSTLEKLTIDGLQINDADVALIADSLCSNTRLTSLSLKGNPIMDAGAFALTAMLSKNSTLVCLDLSNTLIERDGVSSLASSLNFREDFTCLAFESMPLANYKARELQREFREFPAFKISTDSDRW